MKVNCGTDIIEISRIKESIESAGEVFLNRVYTEKEIEYCESKKSRNIKVMQQDLLQKKLYLKLYQYN